MLRARKRHDRVRSPCEQFARHGAVAGTVHMRGADMLQLNAAVNIPPKVVEIVRSILHDQATEAIARVRDHYVDRIGATRSVAAGPYQSDLAKMKETLETMVLLG